MILTLLPQGSAGTKFSDVPTCDITFQSVGNFVKAFEAARLLIGCGYLSVVTLGYKLISGLFSYVGPEAIPEN